MEEYNTFEKICVDNNISLLENKDFNLKDDLNNSHIYVLKNTKTHRLYVGKANCFTGKNNNTWGTLGRWKSHVDEALKNKEDHCVLLNNSIRKYGEESFEVYTVYKGPIDTIGEVEETFIDIFDSLSPNGYNLKRGGDRGIFHEETKKKMSDSKIGTKLSEERKQNISKGQIGNRRNARVRTHEEDRNLPKYVCALREKGNITGYSIHCFPIGTHEKEYLQKMFFSKAKYGSLENALDECLKHLEEIKITYNYVEEKANQVKLENKNEKAIEKKTEMVQSTLPEFIYPIIKDNKIKGYRVNGICNKHNNPYPERIFIDNTNKWNLDKAQKYIDILNYINENNVDMSKFDISIIDINTMERTFYEKFYLPKYVNVLRLRGEVLGFCINGYPNPDYSDSKYKKEFRMKGLGYQMRTLEQSYNDCINHLKYLNTFNELKSNV